MDPGSVIGEGKVAEINNIIEESQGKIQLVVFDNDLSPRQVGQLEDSLKCKILDRRGVIVEIFHRHAKTREAKLQVEIARLNYEAPRIRFKKKGQSDSESRLGEKGIELDKRRIKDRISDIKKELKEISKSEGLKRKKRQNTQTVALVGYTNAGKSSLMRGLTGSKIYVADKLFATLDTKVRALVPPATPDIFLIDTVGFINKLPHDLVASFRSTLDEAKEAALILYVVDAHDSNFRSQLQITHEVLNEIGLSETQSITIFNKIDQVDEKTRIELRKEFPQGLQLSALNPIDVSHLRALIVKHFEKGMKEAEFKISFAQGSLIDEIHRTTHVLEEKHEEDGSRLKVRAPNKIIEKLKKLINNNISSKR